MPLSQATSVNERNSLVRPIRMFSMFRQQKPFLDDSETPLTAPKNLLQRHGSTQALISAIKLVTWRHMILDMLRGHSFA